MRLIVDGLLLVDEVDLDWIRGRHWGSDRQTNWTALNRGQSQEGAAGAQPIFDSPEADGSRMPFTVIEAEIGRDLRLSAETIPSGVTVRARSLRRTRSSVVDLYLMDCPDQAALDAAPKGGG